MLILRWADNGDWIGTMSGHKGALRSCAAKKNIAVTASTDQSAMVWNILNGERLLTIQLEAISKATDLTDDANLLAIGIGDTIGIFDLRIHSPSQQQSSPATTDASINFNSSRLSIKLGSNAEKIAWISTNEPCVYNLIAGLSDGSIDIYKIVYEKGSPSSDAATSSNEFEDDGIKATSEFLKNVKLGPESKVTDLEIRDTNQKSELFHGSKILTACCGDKVFFLDILDSFKQVLQHQLPRKVVAASLHPSGDKCIVAEFDSLDIKTIDLKKGVETIMYRGHHGPVFTLRYSIDGESFISGSGDSSVRIWSLIDSIKSEQSSRS